MFYYVPSGKLQHVVFGQDALSPCVHQRQGVDDDVEHGRRLALVFNANQVQEVASVGEGEEDELSGLA